MCAKAKSEEVMKVLDGLSEEEIKQLRKDNPFRVERNKKIKELYRRGVKVCVLSEIAGISQTSVLRTIRSEQKYYTKALKVKI